MDSSTHQASTSHQPEFTPEMRDRQARGKDPYSDESERDDGPYRLGSSRFRPKGSMAAVELRGSIMSILDSPEALLASALSNGNTIPQERSRLLELFTGYNEKNRKPHSKLG